MTSEKDPDGLDPHEEGAKLDAGKAGYTRALRAFPRAISAVNSVSIYGEIKYTLDGWQSVDDGERRYSEAMMRHFVCVSQDDNVDNDSGLHHAAHVAWNALAVLELKLRRFENERNRKETPSEVSDSVYETAKRNRKRARMQDDT